MMTFHLATLSTFGILVVCDFNNPRYYDFDVGPLLENDRILISYTKCFLDKGPCTPDAKEFKRDIPEVLRTSCGKCTDKQKEIIRQVIGAVMIRHPKSWMQLLDKYDPEKKYFDDFNKFIAEE
ncbi:PREDICTED: ejaculatory bulb-specific protein 3-like [Papilio xuthus]|uniref:Ejaculatory bulb-specific protein 3-like n=1 Tax=Papilio xuthus TaxID=66420 RepID=A0AAJ6ZIY1_PAPXU|nr:PREDICTED: ejaculatory bulb-specific protein 3-like [Papilio xuthus]